MLPASEARTRTRGGEQPGAVEKVARILDFPACEIGKEAGRAGSVDQLAWVRRQAAGAARSIKAGAKGGVGGTA